MHDGYTSRGIIVNVRRCASRSPDTRDSAARVTAFVYAAEEAEVVCADHVTAKKKKSSRPHNNTLSVGYVFIKIK